LDRKPTLQNIYKRSHYQHPVCHTKELTTETLTTFETAEELVKKCLFQLKTDKSPGTDGISPRMLKMSEQLHVPLNAIFKLSINTTRDSGEMQLSAQSTKYLGGKRGKLQASVPDISRLQDWRE